MNAGKADTLGSHLNGAHVLQREGVCARDNRATSTYAHGRNKLRAAIIQNVRHAGFLKLSKAFLSKKLPRGLAGRINSVCRINYAQGQAMGETCLDK